MTQQNDQEWQPIETAPDYDDEAFLVWCPEYKNIYLVTAFEDGVYMIFGGGNFLEEVPTMWCKLPERPSSGQ